MNVTLYKFTLDVSDVDRGFYETLEFRVVQHPSEAHHYLLTRVLAFALNYREGLAFATVGLSDPDVPALSIPDELMIEIGNPSARKLHKATKATDRVRVYTYKNAENLIKEIEAEKVHRAEAIEVFSLTPSFLDELAEKMKKDNRWGLLVNEGVITVQIGDASLSGDLRQWR